MCMCGCERDYSLTASTLEAKCGEDKYDRSSAPTNSHTYSLTHSPQTSLPPQRDQTDWSPP